MQPRLASLALAAGAALVVLAPLPARAQTAPCGPSNPENQCFDQQTTGVVSIADDDELFGGALAFGDFDGDGFDDLAIGAPGERRTANGAGLVHVFRGSADGLTAIGGSVQFDQAGIVGETVEAGDAFGFALAAGDLDGDGFDDLAIGAPFEDHPGCPLGCTDSGVFHVVYGGASGLDPEGGETFTNDLGVAGADAADGNHFGSTLGTGRFDDDGIDDLLVCAPGYDSDKGRCFVVFGSPSGLDQGASARVFGSGSAGGDRQGNAAVAMRFSTLAPTPRAALGDPRFDNGSLTDAGSVRFGFITIQGSVSTFRIEERHVDTGGQNHEGTRFGEALAVGRFNDDDLDDLAVGGPGRAFVNADEGGFVYVLFGQLEFDPEDLPAQRLTQNNLLGPGEIEAGDATGSALVAGDFDDDGFDDLAIGAPGEGANGAGSVIAVHGGPAGLDPSRVIELLQAPGLGGTNAAADNLGQVLATGDVDGDGRDELAIGVPLKDVDGHGDAGMVYIHYFPDPTPSPDIFADGFESGDTSAWSAAVP